MEHTNHHNESQYSHHETVSKMKDKAGALESWLAPLFAKAPHLPEGGRKVVTDIAPWLSLIFGVLGLLALTSGGMLALLLSPLLLMSGSLHVIISVVFGIISAVLSILSFKPLQEMKKTGWNLAFYSLIISSISTIVSILFVGSLGGVLGIVLGCYVLFEVREMYH